MWDVSHILSAPTHNLTLRSFLSRDVASLYASSASSMNGICGTAGTLTLNFLPDGLSSFQPILGAATTSVSVLSAFQCSVLLKINERSILNSLLQCFLTGQKRIGISKSRHSPLWVQSLDRVEKLWSTIPTKVSIMIDLSGKMPGLVYVMSSCCSMVPIGENSLDSHQIIGEEWKSRSFMRNF
jgi:hypothetical protein